MKHQRALMMMAMAVLLGMVAVWLASRWLLRPNTAATQQIVVAASDVNLGQRLAPDMLKLADWPAAQQPAGAVTDPLKLSGRVLKSSVLRGEPLSEAKLAPDGTLGGLSALIAAGRRAITVRVNDVIGVAGFALPGNFVDILVNTQEAAAGGERAISKIVLERILVLAVAQEVGRDETRPRVVNAVTLEVTPAQAENLDLARSVGSLSLVLRNQVDPQPGVTAGATKSTLLGVAAPPAPSLATARPAAPPMLGVRVAERANASRVASLASAVDTPSFAPRQCSSVLDGLSARRECF